LANIVLEGQTVISSLFMLLAKCLKTGGLTTSNT